MATRERSNSHASISSIVSGVSAQSNSSGASKRVALRARHGRRNSLSLNSGSARSATAAEAEARAFIRQLLKKIKIFADLSDDQLTDLISALRERDYKRGEFIITQGEIGKKFFILSSGVVHVLINKPQPEPTDDIAIQPAVERTHVATLQENSFFGEAALLHDEPRNASIVAAGPVRCLVLDKDDFNELIADQVGGGDTAAARGFETQLMGMIPTLSKLSPMERRALLGVFAVKTFHDGAYICKQGAQARSLYVIVSGKVAVTVGGQGFHVDKKVAELPTGAFFGESSLIGSGGKRSANVVAMDRVRCIKLFARHFTELCPPMKDILLNIAGVKFLSETAASSIAQRLTRSGSSAKSAALAVKAIVGSLNFAGKATGKTTSLFTAALEMLHQYFSFLSFAEQVNIRCQALLSHKGGVQSVYFRSLWQLHWDPQLMNDMDEECAEIEEEDKKVGEHFLQQHLMEQAALDAADWSSSSSDESGASDTAATNDTAAKSDGVGEEIQRHDDEGRAVAQDGAAEGSDATSPVVRSPVAQDRQPSPTQHSQHWAIRTIPEGARPSAHNTPRSPSPMYIARGRSPSPLRAEVGGSPRNLQRLTISDTDQLDEGLSEMGEGGPALDAVPTHVRGRRGSAQLPKSPSMQMFPFPFMRSHSQRHVTEKFPLSGTVPQPEASGSSTQALSTTANTTTRSSTATSSNHTPNDTPRRRSQAQSSPASSMRSPHTDSMHSADSSPVNTLGSPLLSLKRRASSVMSILHLRRRAQSSPGMSGSERTQPNATQSPVSMDDAVMAKFHQHKSKRSKSRIAAKIAAAKAILLKGGEVTSPSWHPSSRGGLERVRKQSDPGTRYSTSAAEVEIHLPGVGSPSNKTRAQGDLAGSPRSERSAPASRGRSKRRERRATLVRFALETPNSSPTRDTGPSATPNSSPTYGEAQTTAQRVRSHSEGHPRLSTRRGSPADSAGADHGEMRYSRARHGSYGSNSLDTDDDTSSDTGEDDTSKPLDDTLLVGDGIEIPRIRPLSEVSTAQVEAGAEEDNAMHALPLRPLSARAPDKTQFHNEAMLIQPVPASPHGGISSAVSSFSAPELPATEATTAVGVPSAAPSTNGPLVVSTKDQQPHGAAPNPNEAPHAAETDSSMAVSAQHRKTSKASAVTHSGRSAATTAQPPTVHTFRSTTSGMRETAASSNPTPTERWYRTLIQISSLSDAMINFDPPASLLFFRNAAISALQVHPLKRTQAQVGLILLLLRKNAVFTKLTAAFPPTLLHRLARFMTVLRIGDGHQLPTEVGCYCCDHYYPYQWQQDLQGSTAAERMEAKKRRRDSRLSSASGGFALPDIQSPTDGQKERHMGASTGAMGCVKTSTVQAQTVDFDCTSSYAGIVLRGELDVYDRADLPKSAPHRAAVLRSRSSFAREYSAADGTSAEDSKATDESSDDFAAKKHALFGKQQGAPVRFCPGEGFGEKSLFEVQPYLATRIAVGRRCDDDIDFATNIVDGISTEPGSPARSSHHSERAPSSQGDPSTRNGSLDASTGADGPQPRYNSQMDVNYSFTERARMNAPVVDVLVIDSYNFRILAGEASFLIGQNMVLFEAQTLSEAFHLDTKGGRTKSRAREKLETHVQDARSLDTEVSGTGTTRSGARRRRNRRSSVTSRVSSAAPDESQTQDDTDLTAMARRFEHHSLDEAFNEVVTLMFARYPSVSPWDMTLLQRMAVLRSFTQLQPASDFSVFALSLRMLCRRLPAGHVLFRQGMAARELVFILSGEVRVMSQDMPIPEASRRQKHGSRWHSDAVETAPDGLASNTAVATSAKLGFRTERNHRERLLGRVMGPTSVACATLSRGSVLGESALIKAIRDALAVLEDEPKTDEDEKTSDLRRVNPRSLTYVSECMTAVAVGSVEVLVVPSYMCQKVDVEIVEAVAASSMRKQAMYHDRATARSWVNQATTYLQAHGDSSFATGGHASRTVSQAASSLTGSQHGQQQHGQNSTRQLSTIGSATTFRSTFLQPALVERAKAGSRQHEEAVRITMAAVVRLMSSAAPQVDFGAEQTRLLESHATCARLAQAIIAAAAGKGGDHYLNETQSTAVPDPSHGIARLTSRYPDPPDGKSDKKVDLATRPVHAAQAAIQRLNPVAMARHQSQLRGLRVVSSSKQAQEAHAAEEVERALVGGVAEYRALVRRSGEVLRAFRKARLVNARHRLRQDSGWVRYLVWLKNHFDSKRQLAAFQPASDGQVPHVPCCPLAIRPNTRRVFGWQRLRPWSVQRLYIPQRSYVGSDSSASILLRQRGRQLKTARPHQVYHRHGEVCPSIASQRTAFQNLTATLRAAIATARQRPRHRRSVHANHRLRSASHCEPLVRRRRAAGRVENGFAVPASQEDDAVSLPDLDVLVVQELRESILPADSAAKYQFDIADLLPLYSLLPRVEIPRPRRRLAIRWVRVRLRWYCVASIPSMGVYEAFSQLQLPSQGTATRQHPAPTATAGAMVSPTIRSEVLELDIGRVPRFLQLFYALFANMLCDDLQARLDPALDKSDLHAHSGRHAQEWGQWNDGDQATKMMISLTQSYSQARLPGLSGSRGTQPLPSRTVTSLDVIARQQLPFKAHPMLLARLASRRGAQPQTGSAKLQLVCVEGRNVLSSHQRLDLSTLLRLQHRSMLAALQASTVRRVSGRGSTVDRLYHLAQRSDTPDVMWSRLVAQLPAENAWVKMHIDCTWHSRRNRQVSMVHWRRLGRRRRSWPMHCDIDYATPRIHLPDGSFPRPFAWGRLNVCQGAVGNPDSAKAPSGLAENDGMGFGAMQYALARVRYMLHALHKHARSTPGQVVSLFENAYMEIANTLISVGLHRYAADLSLSRKSLADGDGEREVRRQAWNAVHGYGSELPVRGERALNRRSSCPDLHHFQELQAGDYFTSFWESYPMRSESAERNSTGQVVYPLELAAPNSADLEYWYTWQARLLVSTFPLLRALSANLPAKPVPYVSRSAKSRTAPSAEAQTTVRSYDEEAPDMLARRTFQASLLDQRKQYTSLEIMRSKGSGTLNQSEKQLWPVAVGRQGGRHLRPTAGLAAAAPRELEASQHDLSFDASVIPPTTPSILSPTTPRFSDHRRTTPRVGFGGTSQHVAPHTASSAASGRLRPTTAPPVTPLKLSNLGNATPPRYSDRTAAAGSLVSHRSSVTSLSEPAVSSRRHSTRSRGSQYQLPHDEEDNRDVSHAFSFSQERMDTKGSVDRHATGAEPAAAVVSLDPGSACSDPDSLDGSAVGGSHLSGAIQQELGDEEALTGTVRAASMAASPSGSVTPRYTRRTPRLPKPRLRVDVNPRYGHSDDREVSRNLRMLHKDELRRSIGPQISNTPTPRRAGSTKHLFGTPVSHPESPFTAPRTPAAVGQRSTDSLSTIARSPIRHAMSPAEQFRSKRSTGMLPSHTRSQASLPRSTLTRSGVSMGTTPRRRDQHPTSSQHASLRNAQSAENHASGLASMQQFLANLDYSDNTFQ